ncbi:MAG: hypothetical protein EPO07_05735 [Verrucomicrobia bacterium]|nr:MAG: hypothetical protein EPO07_05735 [Verrucomicrobiota bacterium]
MAYSNGSAGNLWDFHLQLNSDRRGFNEMFHFVGADLSAITPKAVDIAGQMKNILPTDAEIFFARLSNNNTAKDSRFVRAATGAGTHVGPGSSPPPTLYDMPQAHLLVRFEDTEGGEVSRKLGPIPDYVVTDERLTTAITDVVGMPALPLGAIGSGTDWFANFNLYMQMLVAYTWHVKSGHAPGGTFQYAAWQNAYVIRTCIKKGGRVFV